MNNALHLTDLICGLAILLLIRETEGKNGQTGLDWLSKPCDLIFVCRITVVTFSVRYEVFTAVTMKMSSSGV
jgi:hypothetical protein